MQLDHLSAADRSDGKLPGGRRRWRSAGRAARACMLVTGRAGPGRHRPGLEVAKAKGWVVDLDRLPAPISARRFPAGRKSTMICLESGSIDRPRAVFLHWLLLLIVLPHHIHTTPQPHIGSKASAWPSGGGFVHPSAREREPTSHAGMLRSATLFCLSFLFFWPMNEDTS